MRTILLAIPLLLFVPLTASCQDSNTASAQPAPPPVVAPQPAGPPVVAQVAALPKNVARENAAISFPDAKCDEVGFEQPSLHSVRCTLKNGVRLYCWAGELGGDCKPIYVPDEVQKAAADAQARAEAARAEAGKAPGGKSRPPQK